MTVEQHCRDRAARADERSAHLSEMARVCEDSIRKTIYLVEAVRWKQESEAWMMTLVVAEFQEKFGPLGIIQVPPEKIQVTINGEPLARTNGRLISYEEVVAFSGLNCSPAARVVAEWTDGEWCEVCPGESVPVYSGARFTVTWPLSPIR